MKCKIKPSLPAVALVMCIGLQIFTGCRKPAPPILETSVNKDSIGNELRQKKWQNTDSLLALIDRTPKEMKTHQLLMYMELGKLYREKSDFVEAVNNHRLALDMALELHDTVEIIQTYNQLGTDFRRIGSLADAAEMHYKAVELAERYSKRETDEGKRLLSYSLNGTGNVYKSLDIKNEALECFTRSAKLDEELGNNLGLAMNYVTIGSVMEHQNKLDSARYYFLLAMRYDSLANSQTGIAICHNRLGQLLQREEKWDEALVHYNAAKDILVARNDVWNRLKTESDMAWIFIQQKRYDEAYVLLNQLKETAQQRKLYGYLEAIYYYLATLHTQRQEYKQANEARRECLVCRDSIQQIQSEQNVLETRVKFERDMGERRINDLYRKNEEEKRQKRLIFIGGSAITALLLSIIAISYYFARLQRRHNKKLRESNSTKDKLFSVISHDLRNPIIAQRNSLHVIAENLSGGDVSLAKMGIDELTQSTESVLDMLNNMLNWARMQLGKMNYKPVNFDIRNVVISTAKLLKAQMQEKNISFELTPKLPTIVRGDKNMIEIALRNLMTNSIKFSKKDGILRVDVNLQPNNQYKVCVIDNGVGLTKEQITHLFQLDKQQSTRGTAGEIGSGLGLIVCKDIIRMHGGKIQVESVPDVETIFSFTIKRG